MKLSPQYRLASLIVLALLIVGIVVINRQLSQQMPTAASPLTQEVVSPLAHVVNDSPLVIIAPTPTAVELAILEPTSTTIVVTAPPPPKPPTIEIDPFPTAIPTPAVTPIPTAAPPYIEGLTAQSAQPFWSYWSQGDEVWSADLWGSKEFVVDAFAATGDHLLGIPPNGVGNDCCEPTPYFSMSPDGQKVALVVVDQATIDAESAFRKFPYGSVTAIYLYDTAQDTHLSLGDGTRPVWSPDSRQVAFWRRGSLLVADAESGEMRVRLQAAVEMDMSVTEYAWSPDSSQIAVLYQHGGWKSGAPMLWILNANDDSEPRMIMQKQYGELAAIRWIGDGRYIYYFSVEGQKDNYEENQIQNLWRLDVADGTTQQLTSDMMLYGYNDFLSNASWIPISGYQLYAPFEGKYRTSDLWLLNVDNRSLLRLTAGGEERSAWYVMPDKAHLLLGKAYPFQLWLFSFVDGTIVELDQINPDMVEYFNSMHLLRIR